MGSEQGKGANRRKHGVAFADAIAALEDELAVTIPDPFSKAEDRFATLGTDSLSRLLVVVYPWRGASIRLISARKGHEPGMQTV